MDKNMHIRKRQHSWTEGAHLSISDVERFSKLGKVFIDVNRLQAPSISSKTLVQRNGVTLTDNEQIKREVLMQTKKPVKIR